MVPAIMVSVAMETVHARQDIKGHSVMRVSYSLADRAGI